MLWFFLFVVDRRRDAAGAHVAIAETAVARFAHGTMRAVDATTCGVAGDCTRALWMAYPRIHTHVAQLQLAGLGRARDMVAAVTAKVLDGVSAVRARLGSIFYVGVRQFVGCDLRVSARFSRVIYAPAFPAPYAGARGVKAARTVDVHE